MEGTPFGRYWLVDLLGRGGMGEVWRAFDSGTDRVVALKLLPANFADDHLSQERFRREARAAAGLDEPHVVPIYDFGEIEGRFFVSMRLIRGQDLHTMLAGGALVPTRAVGIIGQIASALHAAHQIGLVHRDVKPSNVLVAEDDFAYLIDFGIARAAGETGLTSTGAAIGTWAYMAPERFEKGAADARADVYALTCVLHESLIGQPPFPSNTLEQIIAAHMLLPPPQTSALREGIPAEMDHVIATGMAKDPDQRYATTKELALAARAALTAPLHRSDAPRTPRAAPEQRRTQRAKPPPALVHPPSFSSDATPVPPPAPLHAPPESPTILRAGGPTTPATFAPSGFPVGLGAGFYSLPSPGTMVRAQPTESYTPWLTRVLAYLIDSIPFAVVYGIALVIAMVTATPHCVTSPSPSVPDFCYQETSALASIAYGLGGLLVFAYAVWNFGYRQGTTGSSIGKGVMKFKVVSEATGQPLGFAMSFVRQLAHIADSFCLIGYLFPLWDAKRQTFADKIMSTVCLPI